MAIEVGNTSTDLDEIEKALENLRLHGENTPQASQAVSVLADASKHDRSAREKLAYPTVLRSLVEIVESSINDSLETTDLALRCIGNASIDNNDAREILTNTGFSWVRRCMRPTNSEDLNTQILAGKVLYNICCDYEAAQRQCFSEHAHHELIHVLSYDSVVKNDDRSLLIELLFWICSHKEPDSTTEDPLPENLLFEFLLLPKFYQDVLDTDDFAMLLETCLLFLRDAQTERDVVLRKQVGKVMRMLQQNETRIAEATTSEDDRKLLVPLSNSLIWCLSDMAAMPEYVQTYNLDMDWTRWHIIDVITTPDSSPVRVLTAACQILGNLLWAMNDPEDFESLIQSRRLHEYVLGMIVSSQDAELLHAAAGLLIQFSRPPGAREAIGGSENARAALELVCRHDTPQLKQDGIKLLRALGRDCQVNQERFEDLAREVMQTSSETDATMTEAGE